MSSQFLRAFSGGLSGQRSHQVRPRVQTSPHQCLGGRERERKGGRENRREREQEGERTGGRENRRERKQEGERTGGREKRREREQEEEMITLHDLIETVHTFEAKVMLKWD